MPWSGAASRQDLRRRPAPGRWSALECLVHLRDVCVTYTIRVHRARTEDRPVLEPLLNDLRARRFRYNDRSPKECGTSSRPAPPGSGTRSSG
ncbi:DinB family protein [Amycolatopsis sp. NPDC098790]|uniref:DinB family protein n=1 Tax=Amycolatopsis sp. NPDC098790 TaxID=3363939 RepID=UPI003814CCC1